MGTIKLTLTHLRKFWFLRIPRKIKTGFTFSNMAILIACRNLKIDLDEFFDWADKNRTLYFAEMLHSAYVVYCQERYIKPVFDKQQLLFAFGLLTEDKRKEVMTVWAQSESFGVKQANKKKVVKQ